MDLNEKEDEKIVTFSESKPLVDTEVTPKELDETVDEIDEYEEKNNESRFAIGCCHRNQCTRDGESCG